MADLNELQQSVEWLGAGLTKVEDRVDRLYAQARIFTIKSQALEDKWLGMGGNKQVQAKWRLREAVRLGLKRPLPREEPNREEMIQGRKAREVHNALWAIHEELPNLVRVEPEWGGENWATRKTKIFTLVFRVGDTADRVERRLSATLNHALTQSNRTNGGNQVLAWRAKTKGEKRKRAWARQAKEERGEGDEAGPAQPITTP